MVKGVVHVQVVMPDRFSSRRFSPEKPLRRKFVFAAQTINVNIKAVRFVFERT